MSLPKVSTTVIQPRQKAVRKGSISKVWELEQKNRIIQIIQQSGKYLMRVYTKNSQQWGFFQPIEKDSEFFLRGSVFDSWIEFNSFGSFDNIIVPEVHKGTDLDS